MNSNLFFSVFYMFFVNQNVIRVYQTACSGSKNRIL